MEKKGGFFFFLHKVKRNRLFMRVSEIRLLFAIETPAYFITLLIFLSRQNSLIKKKAAFEIESLRLQWQVENRSISF